MSGPAQDYPHTPDILSNLLGAAVCCCMHALCKRTEGAAYLRSELWCKGGRLIARVAGTGD